MERAGSKNAQIHTILYSQGPGLIALDQKFPQFNCYTYIFIQQPGSMNQERVSGRAASDGSKRQIGGSKWQTGQQEVAESGVGWQDQVSIDWSDGARENESHSLDCRPLYSQQGRCLGIQQERICADVGQKSSFNHSFAFFICGR